jgi:16S rRNA (guanine527-N7)-methyltransferase
MHPARIAELLTPYLTPCHSESVRRTDEEPASLSHSNLTDISTYIDLLLRWNSRINLTAIRNEEEIMTRHFGESLFAARHLFRAPSSVFPPVPTVVKDSDFVCGSPEQVREGHDFSRAAKPLGQNRASAPEAARGRNTFHAADLGSGAGFPGIPIKLWAPEIHMTLIESNHKKSTFLREVVRALTLTNIDILTARAESLSQPYDVVTLRAVERFTSILPIAARLTKPTGRLALLIASSQLDEATSSLPAITWQRPIPIPHSESRILSIGTHEPSQ